MPANISGERADLAIMGADLVRKLGGHWSGSAGMCRCPAHADRSPSLSVRLGSTNLLFKCFAGCETRHVLRAIAQFDPRALGQGQVPPVPAADDAWLNQRISELWDEARPVSGTVAERHLRSRGIARQSPALRYHPRVPLGSRASLVRRPALLAAIHEGRRLLALHRTFLDASDGCLARDLPEPRRMLGRPRRGAVMLDAPISLLGLAEGIETALSASYLLDLPVWAVLGNERLARIAIPAGVEQIILLPDNDRAGRRAALYAQDLYQQDGRSVRIELPWQGLNDWNDVLQGHRSNPSVPSTQRAPRPPEVPSRRIDQAASSTQFRPKALA